MIINGGAKPRKNNSVLDIFRRSLEDTVNKTKPNRSRDDDLGKVYNHRLNDLWMMHNQHHATVWQFSGADTFQNVWVCSVDELLNAVGEDKFDLTAPALSLPTSVTGALAVHAWMRAFSLVSIEVMETEKQADPTLHLDSLHKLWVHKYGERQVARQEFVDYYDQLALGIMRLGGYYIPRDLEALTITLGWQKRNAIKNNYLTSKHELAKQNELSQEQLARMVQASDREQ